MTAHGLTFPKRNGMSCSFICLSGSARSHVAAAYFLPCCLCYHRRGSHDHIIRSRRQTEIFWKGNERQARVAPGMVTPLPTPPGPAAPPRCEPQRSQSDEEGWVLVAETCLHDSNRIIHPHSERHSSRWLMCSNINPVHSATVLFEDETTICEAPCFHEFWYFLQLGVLQISAPLGVILEPVLFINQTTWGQTQAQSVLLFWFKAILYNLAGEKKIYELTVGLQWACTCVEDACRE